MSLFTSLIGVSNKGTSYYYTNCPCWGAFNSSLRVKLKESDEKYQFVKVGIFTNGSNSGLTNNTATKKEDIKKYLTYIGNIMGCPLVGFEDYKTNYQYLIELNNSIQRLGKTNKPLEYYEKELPNRNLKGYQATFDISKPMELEPDRRDLFFKHFGPLVRMSYENTFNPALNDILALPESKQFLFKHFTFYELLYLAAAYRNLTGQGHSAWPRDCFIPNVKKFLKIIYSTNKNEKLPSSMFNCFKTVKDIEVAETISKIIGIRNEEPLLSKLIKLNKEK